MGYQIRYDSVKIKHEKKTGGKFPAWIACTLGLVAGLYLWGGREKLCSVLLPGDPQVTKQAVSELVESLGEGEAFSDAFAVFCQTVIHSGEANE